MNFISKRASWRFDKNSLSLTSSEGGSGPSGCGWILTGGRLLLASLERASSPGTEEWRVSDHLLREMQSHGPHASLSLSLNNIHVSVNIRKPGHSLPSMSSHRKPHRHRYCASCQTKVQNLSPLTSSPWNEPPPYVLGRQLIPPGCAVSHILYTGHSSIPDSNW